MACAANPISASSCDSCLLWLLVISTEHGELTSYGEALFCYLRFSLSFGDFHFHYLLHSFCNIYFVRYKK